MTYQQKLEAVRQKCLEVNPEIVELEFGCHVKTAPMGIGAPENEYCIFTIVGQDINGKYRLLERRNHISKSSFQEIIGRPIRLTDVLLAINGGKKYYAVTDDGKIAFLAPAKDSNARYIVIESKWNLHKDSLDEQSEATIDFLYELLK